MPSMNECCTMKTSGDIIRVILFVTYGWTDEEFSSPLAFATTCMQKIRAMAF